MSVGTYGQEELSLPEGWKPFAVVDGGLSRIYIVARKWVRANG